jgi:hypothetical protein
MLAQFQQRDEPRGEERANVGGKGIGRTLDLSASRAYDSALEILGAYKLTANFHLNLEIVLKDIDAFDRVTFEIEPRSQLPYSPDCRHVLFRPNANVHMDQFSEIIRSIKGRVGFDGTRPWWTRLFH